MRTDVRQSDLTQIVPPPGIADAYATAASQLSDQLNQVDQADSKLGVAIGVLSVSIGFLSAVSVPQWLRLLVGALLVMSFGAATLGFFRGRGDYVSAPAPMMAKELAGLQPDVAKTILIDNVVAAFEANQVHLVRKEALLRITIIGFGVTLLVVVIARSAGVA